MNIQPLPIRAGLEQYIKQARHLLEAYRSRDPEAMRAIRQHHPRLPGRANTNDRNGVSDSLIRKTRVTLADAQSVVARCYAFESWPALRRHTDALERNDSRVLRFELAVEAIITGDLTTL